MPKKKYFAGRRTANNKTPEPSRLKRLILANFVLHKQILIVQQTVALFYLTNCRPVLRVLQNIADLSTIFFLFFQNDSANVPVKAKQTGVDL